MKNFFKRNEGLGLLVTAFLVFFIIMGMWIAYEVIFKIAPDFPSFYV